MGVARRCAVRELVHLAVRSGDANVVEAGRSCQIGDRLLLAGEEVHMAGGIRSVEHGDEVIFRFNRVGRCVRGVDAGDDDFVLMPGVKSGLP